MYIAFSLKLGMHIYKAMSISWRFALGDVPGHGNLEVPMGSSKLSSKSYCFMYIP